MLIVKQDEFGLVLRDTEIGGIRCALMEYHTHRFCQLVEAETLIERMDSLSCPFLYFRRFLKKNFLIQDVGAGLIKMSYLGNAGWRFNRFSTACIAAFPSEIPFW